MQALVRLTLLVLMVAGLALMAHASAQQTAPPEPVMQLPPELADFKITPMEELLLRKLDLSQDVLEAVVTQDSEALREYALEFVGLVESEEWTTLGGTDPAYAGNSTEFRKAVRALHVMAKDKDPKNMAKAYYNMVDRCVACHAGAQTKQAE